MTKDPQFGRSVRWMSRLERPLLAVLALIAGAIWAFLYLADEVKEGSTAALDRSILLWFRHGQTLQPLGPRWLQETERDFTARGGFTILTRITVFAVVMLLITDGGSRPRSTSPPSAPRRSCPRWSRRSSPIPAPTSSPSSI